MTANRVVLIALGVFVALLVAAGIGIVAGGDENASDPTRLDEHAKTACGALIREHDRVVTRAARADLAQEVMDDASRSITRGLADAGRTLGVAADSGPASWRIAADLFAQACLDAGWPRKPGA